MGLQGTANDSSITSLGFIYEDTSCSVAKSIYSKEPDQSQVFGIDADEFVLYATVGVLILLCLIGCLIACIMKCRERRRTTKV